MNKKFVIFSVVIILFLSNYSLITTKMVDGSKILSVENDFPTLKIEYISGGLGIKANIKNIGNVDAYDIEWSISICGGNTVINRVKSSTISSLQSGETKKIRMFPFGIGFGIITKLPEITVTVKIDETNMISEKVTAKIIGPIVIIINDEFPKASFSYSPRNIIIGEEIQFSDFSEDPDGEIEAWYWDFGDGNISTEKNPLYSYEKSGIYPVVLTVTDDQGATDSYTMILGIYSTLEPNEDCDCPACCIDPQIYDSNGSNDPLDFLGDRISSEKYSDWKNYTPLVQQVNNLTCGLTDDYDKLLAIATYVKNSKEYGPPGDSHFNSTVIDIFNYEKGVCIEASILLSAMLRLAGIPTKSVGSMTVDHVFNDVFVNNTWLLVDATFDWEVPIIVDNLSSMYFPNMYFNYSGTFYNITYKDSYNQELILLNTTYLFKGVIPNSELIKQNYGEGIIVSPLVSYPVYRNKTGSDIFIEKTNYFTDVIWFYQTKYEVVDDFGMSNGEYDWINRGVDIISAPSQHFARSTKNTGYYKMFLPAFKYRAYFTLDGNNIGFYDFEIKDGQTTIIKPEDISKCSEASQNNYNALMCLINRLPSYNELITK